MKRRWKRLPTLWKKRAGAAKTRRRCWESATKRYYIRCGNSTWIRREAAERRPRRRTRKALLRFLQAHPNSGRCLGAMGLAPLMEGQEMAGVAPVAFQGTEAGLEKLQK